MSARTTVKMTVNGKPKRVSVPPMKRLLDVLRDECGLTGTKEGCGEGECGACSVLMNGAAVNACLIPAIHADGARIVTVEGLAKGPRLSALQDAFVTMGGSQCGMCTPGMLVASVALLDETKGRVPTDEEVRVGLAGTLCRCTGYQKIVDAVRAAAGAKTAPKPAPRRRAVAKRAAPRRAATKKRAAAPKRAAAKPRARVKPAAKRAAKRGRR